MDPCAPPDQSVRAARDILTRSRGEIERDLAPEKKAKGIEVRSMTSAIYLGPTAC